MVVAQSGPSELVQDDLLFMGFFYVPSAEVRDVGRPPVAIETLLHPVFQSSCCEDVPGQEQTFFLEPSRAEPSFGDSTVFSA